MRMMKKLLFIIIASAGTLLAVLLLAAAALLAEPQWFLTSRNVSRAALAFGGALHPRWKTLEFDISSRSLHEKQLHLRLQDFCFEYADAGLEGCLKDADIGLDVSLYFFGAKLTNISSLNISGDHLLLDQTKIRPAAQPEKKQNTGVPNLLPAALRGITIQSLKVDLPSSRVIEAGGGSLRGALHLSLPASEHRRLALKVEIAQSSGTVTRHYRGEGSLDSDLLKRGVLSYLDARGRLKAEGVDASFKARVSPEKTGALNFSLEAAALLPGRRAEAFFAGRKNGLDLTLAGHAGVWQSTGAVRSVRLRQCTLAARLKNEPGGWDTLKLNSGFELEPDLSGVGSDRVSLPKKLEGRLALSARSTPEMLAGDHFDAEVSATVDPVKEWYEFYGDISAEVSGRSSRLQELEISHKFNLFLKIASFDDLVGVLARTRYSVPAPVNVLHGPLNLALKSSGGPGQDPENLDYTLTSGLAAGRQALKFEIKGRLTAADLSEPGRSFKDETDIILQDVALQLPRYDIKGGAAFIPDSRIKSGTKPDTVSPAPAEKRGGAPGGSGTAMQAEVRLRTVKPVLFYSNLAKDPVPVGLDMNLSVPSGAMQGTVDIKPFRAEIFRRIASIDHLKLTARAGSPVMDLDGLILYQAAETKILIHLLGTSQKPQVQFDSDPPMKQADIMAMLLFGKSPNELDSDQQASAANTQTGVANSAFGLASLYLLASTPVEYVGYDPVLKTYTVKFRLPGGATLQVGSDGTSKGVQLRKRIASNLALQTELTNTQTQGNVVTTLLEWYGRR